MTNLFLAGDYYIKIDNACISENESSGGVVNLESSEPYLYKLEAVNAAGDKTEIEFGASRELRQDAFLKLDLQPIRGVVGWSEVSEDSLLIIAGRLPQRSTLSCHTVPRRAATC